ncbi:MAG: RNA-binding protein [Chryseobacterium sp.]|nr:MAG: RNA-binding protein [Chryseobacterium sp.]
MNIFISNLNYSTQDNELRELFENYGEVQSAKIIMDRETGRSRGFGFVEMPDTSSAEQAVSELNQKDFQGKRLNVSEARPKEDRPARGGGYNNNRGGGYNDRGGNDRRNNNW